MTESLPKQNNNPLTAPFRFIEEQATVGVQLIGQVCLLFVKTLWYILRLDLDWRETFRQAYMIGWKSSWVVLITAIFTGFAMSLQISRELVGFGADTAIGGVVSLALIREIGPITAGVMVAGRVGSSIAAELTTMMVTEQIDALKVMRVDPVRFLVVPRYAAALVMIPTLSTYAMFVGLLAGIIIAKSAANLPPETFLDSVRQTILDRDFAVHYLKSAINATIIIFFSCAIGLNTRGGAEDVGIATTRAIVWTMTAIFIFNFIVTSLTYAPR
ncbi:MAG: ABC transporter permease [Candidatus Obscuribacterales bacterium]|nr:ABC transporter permease [Candidatus Obscuribacterales bacterium]